jgi:hypothetical protein
MADLRIPPQSLPVVPRTSTAPARVDAARAAQQAFFRTALEAQSSAPAPPRPVAPEAEPAAPAQRLPRPGSLLDIKV